MTDINAAGLPDGTVVVDDLRGLAWYAGPPGTDARWTVTGTGDLNPVTDHDLHGALLHGAEVLRYGGPEQATAVEIWAARLDGPDGARYSEGPDREHAELVADSIATHLEAVAAGRDTRGRGPEVTGVALVVRDRRVFRDGSEHLTAWRLVRDGKPVQDVQP